MREQFLVVNYTPISPLLVVHLFKCVCPSGKKRPPGLTGRHSGRLKIRGTRGGDYSVRRSWGMVRRMVSFTCSVSLASM